MVMVMIVVIGVAVKGSKLEWLSRDWRKKFQAEQKIGDEA
jgi:hypothetical protein